MSEPKTGAPEWTPSQANPWLTVNEAIRRVAAGGGLFRVEDNDATAPPGSCADGAQYIPAATATGAWAGKEKNIAIAVGADAASGWYFIAPEEGMRAWVKDEDVEHYYNGSAWAAATAPGVGTAAALDSDTDGTLAANSDSKIATQKATKTYVDAKVAGLSWKQAVRVATTANGTLASAFENGDTVDGVVLATGDRILIKNQSSGAENGIYVVAASGAPTRATDADAGAELVNASVYVSEGTTNADTQWVCTNNATPTLGSTALVFAQFGASPTLYRPIGFFFTTTPTTSEVLCIYVANESLTLADDFAGSTGTIGTNPASSFVMDVQKNGVSVGSITVSTGGSYTFATTGTTVSLASGDVLKVIAPATPDATAANAAINFKGTL